MTKSDTWTSTVLNLFTNVFIRRSETALSSPSAAAQLKLVEQQKSLIAERFQRPRKVARLHVKPTASSKTTTTTTTTYTATSSVVQHTCSKSTNTKASTGYTPIIFRSTPGAHRFYVDEVCTPRESLVLINALNNGLLDIGFVDEEKDRLTTSGGESVINPLYCEEVLGPAAYCVIGELKERMQKIAEEVHGVKLHDSGALLARLRIPSALKSVLLKKDNKNKLRHSSTGENECNDSGRITGFQVERGPLESLNNLPGGHDQLRQLMCSTYATPHIDKANRINYDVSCVLYLNDSAEWVRYSRDATATEEADREEDKDRLSAPSVPRATTTTAYTAIGSESAPLSLRPFEGGRFAFNDEDGADTVVVPKRGRLLVFDSGPENMHQVQHVLKGSRYTLAVWFTKDDGRAGPYPMY